jgi:hypothetical protein
MHIICTVKGYKPLILLQYYIIVENFRTVLIFVWVFRYAKTKTIKMWTFKNFCMIRTFTSQHAVTAGSFASVVSGLPGDLSVPVLRSQTWRSDERAGSKKVSHQGCNTPMCNMQETRRISLQWPTTAPPPLLEFRIKEDRAFTYTGVDFASLQFVRNGFSNCSSKAWICLFTCLVTWAIHLDIVSHSYDV